MRLLVISLVLGLVGCGMAEQRHSTDNVYAPQGSDAGIAFHSSTGWVGAVPFLVESAAPDQVIEAAMQAAASWNDAVGHEVLVFSGVSESNRGESLYESLNDDLTIVYYEADWFDTTGKSKSTLATTVWENAPGSDQIIKGDIVLNAEVYMYQDSTEPAIDKEKSSYMVDTETVLLHEFGHLLGLDHVSEDDDAESIMHAKTFIGAYMYARNLSDDDVANIGSLYNK